MRLKSGLLFSAAIALAVSGVAYAQGGLQAAREAEEKACAADVASLCAGKVGHDAAECLNAAGDKVSPVCKDALSKAGGADAAGGPRSPPSLGGAVGVVSDLSATGFQITTAAGRKVNVTTVSSTTYRKGSGAISADAIAGAYVRVLGTVGFGIQGVAPGANSTNIAAVLVVVQPAPASGAAPLPPPPQHGGPHAAAVKFGQVPADYVEGGGTIVNGTEAIKVVEAALASSFYQGGVINRVVKVNSTTYECHSGPPFWTGGAHHLFISAPDFKVVGSY